MLLKVEESNGGDDMKSISQQLASGSVILSVSHGNNAFSTLNTSTAYNNQFSDVYTGLNELRVEYQSKVDALGKGDYSMRSKGVSLGWKYEKANIELGGKGTTNWTSEQRQEIIETGKVRGSEGHHINNVSDHSEHQANPDNIKFARTREEHINDFHRGNAHNETTGDMFDRNKQLEVLNRKRVIHNELKGIGIAIAISTGVGFTIGFAMSLAQNGISKDNIIAASKDGLNGAGVGAMLGIANYVGIRLLGPLVSDLIVRSVVSASVATQSFMNVEMVIGAEVMKNIVMTANIAAAGVISLGITGTILYVKNRRSGYSVQDSLILVGKNLRVSAGIVIVSILCQAVIGGHAGLISGLVLGGIYTTYIVVKTTRDRRVLENVYSYSIECLEPVMLGEER